MAKEEKKKTVPGCTLGKFKVCGTCARCGWNTDEIERRNAIPLEVNPETGYEQKFLALHETYDEEGNLR